MKTTMFEMKNTLDRINNIRLTLQKISEFED